MDKETDLDHQKGSEDEKLERSILIPFTTPRKTVEHWGKKGSMGLGVESCKDPWYYHRPVFDHVWKNAYLGVGQGAKAVERYYIPKQHLYYLSLLLHDALLQEKYVQAAYIMIAISQNPQTLPEQIWRCGMEVLKQCPSSLMGTKRKFYKLMSSLCPQYSNQMVIDMAFQILSDGNDAREAYQFLVSNINNKRVKYNVLFRACFGMFEYVLWKMSLNQKKSHDSLDEYSEVTTETVSGENMSFNAKRALESMRIVLYEHGIWDCIVLKMVEIFDYYNNVKDALLVLESYRDKNMDNPNTHRYLYLYMKKTNQKLDKHFDVLRDLIKLDITNDLAHEFFEKLKSTGENCQLIELLFQRLDHCCCKDNADDWRMLFLLSKSYKKHSSSPEWSKIQSCLLERKTWWPKYHFRRSRMASSQESKRDNESITELSKYKRKIASYFKVKGSHDECLGSDSSSAMACDTESSFTESYCKDRAKRHLNRSVDDSCHRPKKGRTS